MAEKQFLNALQPGYRLHWYTIERVLGQGGFGITYLARDSNLDQSVAIKEYLPGEIASRAADLSIEPRTGGSPEQFQWGLERFLSEARTLARFDHPNIARVYSVFEANGTAYLVMRYEKGEAFNTYLERHQHLSESELLDIILPILDGLKKVHAAGFIHRDIQPANICIRDDGTPVLLDFGAAREAGGKHRTVTILVAPGYAPIEQYYTNIQEQGPWTDIYGLGATLYRAVTGVAPLDAIERSRGLLGSTRDVLVPATVSGQGRYSEGFLTAIDHALKFNEKERPQTVDEWHQELSGTAPSQPAPAPPAAAAAPAPASGGERDRPPVPPPVVPVAAATAAAEPAQPAAGGRGLLLKGILGLAVVFVLGLGIGMWMLRDRDGAPVETGTVTDTGMDRPVQAQQSAQDSRDDLAAATRAPVPPAAGESSAAGVSEPPPAAVTAATDEPQPTPDAGAVAAADQARVEIERLQQQRRRDQEALAQLQEQKQQEIDALEQRRRQEEQRLADVERNRRLAQERLEQMQENTSSKAAEPAEPASIPDPNLTFLDTGVAAYQKGEYQNAFGQLRPLAERGEPLAQYYLALMYRDGRGVLNDNTAALGWMRRAARGGQLEAQLALAAMYGAGIDGKRDLFIAYTWYQVAERNGAAGIAFNQALKNTETELQAEQLPQAKSLASYLYGQQAAAGGGRAVQE